MPNSMLTKIHPACCTLQRGIVLRRYVPREVDAKKCEPFVRENCTTEMKTECSEVCQEDCQDHDKKVCMTIPYQECTEKSVQQCRPVQKFNCLKVTQPYIDFND